MHTELLIFFITSVSCSAFLFVKRRLYSGAVLGLAAFMLGYIFVITMYKYDVSITTMHWPVSDAELIKLAVIILDFVAIFFATNLIVNYFRIIKMRKNSSLAISSRTSRKDEKIFFYWTIGGGLLLLSLTADGWWLFAPYPESKKIWSDFNLRGAGFLILLGLLFGFRNGLRLGRYYRRFTVVLILLVCGHFILAGDRGSLLFVLLGVATFYFLEANKIKRRRLKLAAFPGGVGLLFFLNEISVWRSWGVSAQNTGLAGFASDIDLLPQALAHLSHSIKIVSVYGTYFDNVIVFFGKLWLQIIPGAVLEYFGVEVYSGAWRLADYVRHGGGFFVPAEMYFVGGYTGVVLISMYFSFVSVINDRILFAVFQKGVDRGIRRPEIVLVCLSLGALPYSFFYGLQSFHRMLSLPVLFVMLMTFLKYPIIRRKLHRFRTVNLQLKGKNII